MSDSTLKIAYITAGAGGMYCGSCMHDNTLAQALARVPGVECLLIPTYTPIRTDEPDVSIHRVFMGGITVYLKQLIPFMRWVPNAVTAWLDQPWLIRRVAGRAVATSPKKLGALTLSMLKGSHGRQRREFAQLVGWLKDDLKPDVVNFSNILIAGCVPDLKEALPNTTVLATLQGDDIFLRDLPEPYQSEALSEIQQLGKFVDGFLIHSQYYADFMSSYLQLARDKFEITPLGINLRDFESFLQTPPRESSSVARPLTIGYLARLAPEKGLHLLVEAFIKLRTRPEFSNVRLALAGWLGPQHRSYVDKQFELLKLANLQESYRYVGSVDRAQKLDFLRSIDVLSVPTTYEEPKGLYVLESLAAGKPVIEPAHGAFPERIAAFGGGLLFRPGDTNELAEALAKLLRDEQLRMQLGREGQRAVHERFSAEAMAADALRAIRRFRR